jgi:hypothetical protein
MMDVRSAIREDRWAGLLSAWPCIGRETEDAEQEQP